MLDLSLTAESAAIALQWEDDGSGDYLVSIEAEADAFRGHADGYVSGTDLRRFIEDLRRLDESRKGKAQLASAIPGEFEVTVQAINGAGHLAVSGVLRYARPGPERPRQVFEFFFEIEPSQLSKAASDARAF